MKTKNRFTLMPGRAAVVTLALAATMSLGQAIASPKDLDGDGISNRLDPDVDGDGILNGADRNVDGGICRKGPRKGKFVGDHLKNDDSTEKDIDGDGLSDDSKSEFDIDGDGLKDDSPKERDIDGDGHSDKSDDDIDGDGRHNGKDDDCDGDGRGRAKDHDDDGDSIDDSGDHDDDNDGLSDDDESEVEVRLSATAAAPSGSRVRAKVKQHPSGKIELEFDGRGLAAGDYDVVVDGQVLGTLSMIDDKGRTEGEVHFETNPNKTGELPLPFNPFGLPVLIVDNGVTYFSGTVPTPTDVFVGDDDDDHGGEDSLTSALVKAPGLSSEAEGSVEIQVGATGVRGLEVEVEAIPAGAYDFIVGGVNRGTLSVILVKGKLRGKLRYEVVPDGNDEILLDFPVAGESIVISQGATTFFSGTAPTTI
jgi:hypothetical protein